MSFVVSLLHPQQLTVGSWAVSIVIVGFPCRGYLRSGRFLGLSFRIFGDTPSSSPPVGASLIFFQFTALMLSSSVVLMLFTGPCVMGDGCLLLVLFFLHSPPRVNQEWDHL